MRMKWRGCWGRGRGRLIRCAGSIARFAGRGRLWGTTLVGPTATYVEGKGNCERGRMEIAEFAEDAETMLPEISAEDLQLGYSGLRPKLKAPGEKGVADFVIEADHEVPRVIQLVGIESPGLTAAPAIAEHVAGFVARIL